MLHSIRSLRILEGTLLNYWLQQSSVSSIKSILPIVESYEGCDWKQYAHKFTTPTETTSPTNTYYKQKVSFTSINPYYEMYVITWPPYSQSKIHNHAPQGCVQLLLDSPLLQHVYNSSFELLGIESLTPFEASYIDDSVGYHSIHNPTNEFVHSLHIYSPPNFQTTYF